MTSTNGDIPIAPVTPRHSDIVGSGRMIEKGKQKDEVYCIDKDHHDTSLYHRCKN